MNILDKYLGSTAFFRQAPDAPSGGADSGSAPTSSGSSASESGTSAPSETPSPSPSSSAPEASSDIDFDMFFGGVEPPSVAPAPEPKPAPAPKPEEAPPPATPPAPEPPKAPEPKPAVPPAAASPSPTEAPPQPASPAAAPAQPPLDPSDPASLATHLQENEAAMIDHVAKAYFQITPQEMEELETNVGEAIPKLLAKTFVKMQGNMLQQMSRLVPGMVQRTSEAIQRNVENEARFFTKWPQLKPQDPQKAAEYAQTMRTMAVTYRQMYPQATLEKMIDDLGPLVMMRVGVNPTQVVAAPPAPPKPQPFVPATPGATAVSHTPVEEDSAIASLDPMREF